MCVQTSCCTNLLEFYLFKQSTILLFGHGQYQSAPLVSSSIVYWAPSVQCRQAVWSSFGSFKRVIASSSRCWPEESKEIVSFGEFCLSHFRWCTQSPLSSFFFAASFLLMAFVFALIAGTSLQIQAIDLHASMLPPTSSSFVATTTPFVLLFFIDARTNELQSWKKRGVRQRESDEKRVCGRKEEEEEEERIKATSASTQVCIIATVQRTQQKRTTGSVAASWDSKIQRVTTR